MRMQNHVQMLQQMLKDRDADIRALRQKVQPDASAELSRGQRNHIEDARQAQRQIDNLRQLMDAHKLWEAESSGANSLGTVLGHGSGQCGSDDPLCHQLYGMLLTTHLPMGGQSSTWIWSPSCQAVWWGLHCSVWVSADSSRQQARRTIRSMHGLR